MSKKLQLDTKYFVVTVLPNGDVEWRKAERRVFSESKDIFFEALTLDRENGPAVSTRLDQFWYLDGKKYTHKEYQEFASELLKRKQQEAETKGCLLVEADKTVTETISIGDKKYQLCLIEGEGE